MHRTGLRLFSEQIKKRVSLQQLIQPLFDQNNNHVFCELFIEENDEESKIRSNKVYKLKTNKQIGKGEPILRISTDSCVNEDDFYERNAESKNMPAKRLSLLTDSILDNNEFRKRNEAKLEKLLKVVLDMYNKYITDPINSTTSIMLKENLIVNPFFFGNEELNSFFAADYTERVFELNSFLDLVAEQTKAIFPAIDVDLFKRMCIIARVHDLPLKDCYGRDLTEERGALLFPLKNTVNHSFDPNCYLHTYFDYPTDTEFLILKTTREIAQNEELTLCYDSISYLKSEP